MMLEAKGLSFGYPNTNRQIFTRLDLSVESGERVGIVAPSGYGKTTLCKVLAGYESPDEGEVSLDGRSVHTVKGYCPVQMIWQHPELVLNPRLRMGEVLAEADGIGPDVLTGLGIERGWLTRYPGELSGGEMQRFCIARALGTRTKFLLADEISTMLDLITQSQLWNFLIQTVERRNIGLLAVSHSSSLLDRICTRQCILDGATQG